jgi:hypothetical protein
VPIDRLGISNIFLGNELRRDVVVQSRVLGLPHDTHAAFTGLLDQAVLEQVLSGFDGHSRVPLGNRSPAYSAMQARLEYADHTRRPRSGRRHPGGLLCEASRDWDGLTSGLKSACHALSSKPRRTLSHSF